MRCFVDTSAIYALVSADDDHHEQATGFFAGLSPDDDLVTHNYVVVECTALVQHRLGVEAAALLHRDLLPRFETRWVDPDVHDAAVSAMLSTDDRDVSLVDHVSFVVMRHERLQDAFAFDVDFTHAGFGVLPGSGR